ncbi:hypothetical protein [Spirosoma jeollabukense]
MNDGLYLNDTWVAEVAPVLNFQVNDLTKPDKLSANYALTFQLPDTLLLRDLLENAEQVDAGGRYPYENPSAQLYEEGELIFSGFAKLKSFSAGWKVDLIQATKDLFEALGNKSLRDLDLSRFDHPWNLSTISSLAGATVGAVYPVIDYGSFDGKAFAADSIFPAVYVHTLIRQMLLETGYHASGGWLDEDLIKRLALPFVDDEPKSRDGQWVEDRSARVTVGPRTTPENPPYYTNKEIDFNPVSYTVDNEIEHGWTDGKQNNFNTLLNAYIPDTAMRLHVQAYQEFSVDVQFGAVEATLQVLVNGQNMAQEYWSVSGPYNPSGTKIDYIKLDEFVNVKKGDQVTIRFTYNKRTTFAQSHQFFPINPQTMWAEFSPDASVRNSDYWPVARNLPDLSCSDLLKTIALISSATLQVDEVKKTVRLITLDSVIAKTAEAVDWSTRVEESEEPELSATLEPYGQANSLKWKELDKVSPFGDGLVRSGAANLPATAELFTLPFAACLPSGKSIADYGNPVQIITRILSGTGTEKTLTRTATTPRLILIEAGKTLEVQANRLTEENTVRNENVILTGAWWGERPVGLETLENRFTLAFDRVATFQREQTLIQRYFSGLKRVLRRPRSLSVPVYLRPEDISTLDLTVPIRLTQVRAGSLDISDCYFYLNQIENYSPGQPCRLNVVPYF